MKFSFVYNNKNKHVSLLEQIVPIQSVISNGKSISLLFLFLPTLNSSLKPNTTKIGYPSQNALNELTFYQLCHPRKCKQLILLHLEC